MVKVRRPIQFLIILVTVGVCWPMTAHPQTPDVIPEDSPAAVPRDLSSLNLDSARRGEIEAALSHHELARAETLLLEETEPHPDSARSAKLFGTAAELFFLDGKFLNAAIAWKKAEAVTPLDDRSRFLLAMTWIKLNRGSWARPELEKLTAGQGQNPLYLYWLARLDYDEQQYTTAITRLRRVIELDPKMARAYDRLGLCQDYLGHFDEALRNYSRAVELNRLQSRPSPWPLLDMSITLAAVDRLPEAEANLREALRFDPSLPQAHYQLGRVLEMEGRYQPAIQSLIQAAALEPAYAEPHYLLGRIYQRLGEGESAKAEIAKFQQLSKSKDVSASQPVDQSIPEPKK